MSANSTTTTTAETTQPDVRFPLGRTFITRGALDTLTEAGQSATEFLARHQRGDWGEVCAEDASENEYSLTHGFRLLSSYRTKVGERRWVITEHNRSATNILLPNEY